MTLNYLTPEQFEELQDLCSEVCENAEKADVEKLATLVDTIGQQIMECTKMEPVSDAD